MFAVRWTVIEDLHNLQETNGSAIEKYARYVIAQGLSCYVVEIVASFLEDFGACQSTIACMNIPIANVVSRRIHSRIWRRSFAYKCTDVSCMLINLLRGDSLLSRAISDYVFINLPCSKVTLRWYIIYTYSLLKLSDPHVILVYTIILWTLIDSTHVCITYTFI